MTVPVQILLTLNSVSLQRTNYRLGLIWDLKL